jgi:hypothetical protein
MIWLDRPKRPPLWCAGMANVFVEQVELYRLWRDDTRSQLYVPPGSNPQNPENLQEAEIPRRTKPRLDLRSLVVFMSISRLAESRIDKLDVITQLTFATRI